MKSSRPADLALVSTEVYTVDAVGRWAQAIAVRDGEIVAVGTDAQIRELVGPHTEVLDLRGRMVLPGFQDAHVHPTGGGMDRLRCDLSEERSLEGYATRIRAYAEANPNAEWILGGGWAMDVFPGGTPRRDDLDRIVPDRPAFLSNRGNHAAWVNSRALELAGVDARTPDPSDGRIERDPDGSPQGTLHEGAMRLVRRLIPDPDAEEIGRGILLAQAYLHSLGITAWQDAIVGVYPTLPNSRDVYPMLAGRDQLTARVVGALWWERGRGVEQVEELVGYRERTTVGRYRATTVKIMQDGVCENLTACMLEPYLDAHGNPTDNRGLAYVDPEELPKIVTALDAAGFQIHVHAIGDRAVRDALDAFETAREENGWNDLRHHMAHLQVVHPEDLPRFRRLGITANGQPLWAANDPQMVELTIPFLGPERAARQYPFASLVRSGARLAFGSDWPVSTPDVLQEIHVAVNRTLPPSATHGRGSGLEREPFLPDERISVAEAIRAFTMGSAYVNHLDDIAGSIEVGKRADLVVLSHNLFELPSSEIASAEVLLTLVDGRPVHEAPGL
ncbi:MAG TPA: amidohydrolase [Actinomycetota bacterium]|nr:amidohydrolase [Actinomycetota bacterium]